MASLVRSVPAHSSGSLRVLPVTGGARLRQFIELPERLFRRGSRWVAPLRMYVRHTMGRLVGAERGFFLAVENGEPVGRIGAVVHRHPGYEALHFGWFECAEGHAEAARRLVEAARGVAPGLLMRGPYQYRQEDFYTGILVDGFDEDPSLFMPWNPPFYGDYLEAAGLHGVADLYSYAFERGHVRLDLMEGRARRARENGVTVRTLDPRHWNRDMQMVLDMTNQTHRDLWGFEEYVGELARELLTVGRFVLDAEGIFLAFHDGRPAGFVIVARDINAILKRSRGRVTPCLLWHLLTQRKRVDVYRAYGMGVLAEARDQGVSAALVQAVMSASGRYPWRRLEIAWTLSTNTAMNAMAMALGGRRSTVHRVYEASPPS